MENQGESKAEDKNEGRLKLISENGARLCVNCVSAELSDPQGPLAPVDAELVAILVDEPCSNSGVMSRRVDLRWRIQEAEIARLQEMQKELLRLAAMRLKLGGVLVYSTCSLEPEENNHVVRAFIEANHAFELDFERQLLPFRDAVDGAYVARFRKSDATHSAARK